ncbi:coiled-coil domain-containing protein [Cylindrospermum sp. FACHB-282]|uniref:coiled-coil domain-containing protein n=1 Tax=Cylindrospermum sp. FACHB-282 TaxID=2692794 RepID=UPI001689DE62|nr:hypothetical protein [Cylindrospermum sp. FACHB-282]MBD2388765.1 hypothetical protein [Cylindrospermum sp. FACHB-282]
MAFLDREQGIMQLIYNKINDMIGGGNQLFSMQFPAQPLNYRMYQYDTNNRNSVLTRPYTVAEQEFRLSDQLFDISPITAGSNGEKLSIVYDTLVNNFIPKIDYLIPFIKDRAGLGTFLLEDSGERDENKKPLSRIELCKKLYKEYLEEKNKWNEEKNKKFDELKAKENGLDEYAKWQSSYAVVRQEELNNLYNDVVVRGLFHEVLTILGYLNASSIAEQLETSKQKMRNSSRVSLDESMTVYPVQFQPNNWFKALSPNLNPEDLTMAKESIRDQFVAKQRELARAKTELQQMQLISANPDEIERLEASIEASKENLNQAESALIKQYGEGVVGIAKIYFNVMNVGGKIGNVVPAKAKKLGATDDSQTYIDALGQAVKGISDTYEKQQTLTSAISNLADLKAKKAQLESRDWQFNKVSMEQRVNELQTEVAYYSDILAGVFKEAAKTTRIDLERKSYVDQTLVYEIGIAPTVTGGSFKLKIGGDQTDPINVTLTSGDIDYAALKSAMETAINAKRTGATITEVSGSSGYWTLTIPNMVDEQSIIAIEDALLPTVNVKEPAILSTPPTEEDAEISGMFQDILLKISDSKQKDEQSLDTQASSTKWGASLWFASASGQSSSASAKTTQRSNFFNQEIEIGFRVAKVSFDRGGWFNPQLFKMSHAFFRLADLRVSPGITVDDVRTKSQTELKVLTEYEELDSNGKSNGKKDKYILPAFPVAMAIAKDITIKVKMTQSNSESTKSVIENSSSASGGFLCFSVSSASSSKSSSEATFHGAHGEYYYIRIPGPQVIGYFLQFVPQDNSVPYTPLITESGSSPVINAFRLFDNAHQLLGADDDRRINRLTSDHALSSNTDLDDIARLVGND